jgi:hypothetical protein
MTAFTTPVVNETWSQLLDVEQLRLTDRGELFIKAQRTALAVVVNRRSAARISSLANAAGCNASRKVRRMA